MTFTSISFIIFIIILTILYYILPKRFQWVILLSASIVFYVSSGWKAIPFVLVTSLAVYWAARAMDHIYSVLAQDIATDNISKEDKQNLHRLAKAKCKRYVILAIIVLLGMLGYVKFTNKIGALMSDLILFVRGFGTEFEPWDLIIPMGISYYTFSSIGYLLDVYWKKDKCEKNYFKVLLYMIYFPQIVEGPIARHKLLVPQFMEEKIFDYKSFCFGVQLMTWGYFKKMVIADRAAIFVNTIMGNLESYQGFYIVIALAFGVVQLYTDFSGCMDIARGISEVFGIRLEKNFDRPFFSSSVAEFWRRWHITLGAWFKDYVYMPVATSKWMMRINTKVKKKKGVAAYKLVSAAVPLMVVWLLTGLWHGTGWNYVVWGIYYGLLIILGMVFEGNFQKIEEMLHINTKATSWRIFQHIRVFLVFMGGRLLTAPGTLGNTIIAAKQMFSQFNIWVFFDGSLYSMGLDRPNFILLLVTIVVLWGVSMLQLRGSVREMIARQNIVVRWLIYYMLFFSILIFGEYGPGFDASSFVYMNF